MRTAGPPARRLSIRPELSRNGTTLPRQKERGWNAGVRIGWRGPDAVRSATPSVDAGDDALGALHVGVILRAEGLPHHLLLAPTRKANRMPKPMRPERPAMRFGSSSACATAHRKKAEYMGCRTAR